MSKCNENNKTYGIIIDMANENPEMAASYSDDAVNIVPLTIDLSTGSYDYGGWEDILTNIIGCRLCLQSDSGIEYIDPNDYTKTVDGNNIDISSGNVMIEFSKNWYKYSIEGNILKFQIANYDRSEDGFICNAFTSMDDTGDIVDFMYYGVWTRLSKSKHPIHNKAYNNTRYGNIDWVR